MENNNQETFEDSDLRQTVPDELLDYPAPNNPPWGILSGISLWFFSVIMIAIVPAIFVIPYLISKKDIIANSSMGKFAANDPTALLINIIAIIPAHIITLILAWFIVTNFNQFSFKETLGWKWGNYNWWQIILGTIVIMLSIILVMNSATWYFGVRTNPFVEMLKSSRNMVYAVAFMGTFTAPIVEEVVYRGVLFSGAQKSLATPISKLIVMFEQIALFRFLFKNLRKLSISTTVVHYIEILQRKYYIHMAVFLVTAIFALVHYPQYWGDPATIVSLTFISLVLTMVRVWTNNLLPCIFLHFVFNGLQSIVLILEPYLPKGIAPEIPQVESFIMLFK